MLGLKVGGWFETSEHILKKVHGNQAVIFLPGV